MNKLLIVVDMQNDFIDGSLGTQEAQNMLENAVREIKKKKKEGFVVLATQDTHYDDYLETLEGQNLPVNHCIENTPGWLLADEIQSEIEPENIFKKNTFGSLDLIEHVKKLNPEEIELIGLCTDICVISNALLLRANFPDVPISVKADCCAGVTPDLHDAALKVMNSCQVEII